MYPRGARGWLLLYAAFSLLCLAVYARALGGRFIADDYGYLVDHPYTASLSPANLWAMLDPTGPAKLEAVNYAPVHLFLSALERQAFADWLPGYHVANVLIHALNAVLLAALLRASAVPAAWALAGALVFAFHPANVEAVAWASQLKTLAAFALAWAALLLLWRRPLVATGLFAAALLTKYLVVSVPLMAAGFAWARADASRAARTWRWLGVWLALCVLVGIPQLVAFGAGGAVEESPFGDPWVQVRTIAAIGARYLVMAATAHGVSAFHEPPASPSWTDPWWLLALLLGALLLGRLLTSLGRRREEAAWWIGAAAAFVPVSQIFPFFYPMGDRYLYFILPGLIGGALLWGMDAGHRILARRPRLGTLLGRSGLVAAALLIGFFGWKTTGRAAVWLDEEHALLDAARNYPEGSSAHYVRAVRAAQRRDVPLAVAELRSAEAVRRLSLVRSLAVDPRLAPLWGEPEFAAFVREIAGYRIELARRRGYDSPAWLRSLASAHAVRGEYDEAVDVLERALRAGGPLRSELLVDLERIEAARRRARAQKNTSRFE